MLNWNYGMNFLFLKEMIFYIVFTQMYVTDTKIQCGPHIYLNIEHNVLDAISGIHSQG